MPKSYLTLISRRLNELWYLTLVYFVCIIPLSGQGNSVSCHGALQVSLDVNCEAEINGLTILTGESPFDKPTDFLVTVTEKGTYNVPPSVFSGSGSGLTFSNTNSGEFIRFTEPGNFVVSVERKSSGLSCWGYVYVENKLPPAPENCACPDTATVIADSCRFSCASIELFFQNAVVTDSAGLNPEFVKNCASSEDPVFSDELVEDTICGNWYIIRTWKAKVTNSHGTQVSALNCKQKFLFEAIESEDIHPPKSKVTVDCGVSTHPDSLLAYFSNTSIFPDANKDDAVACAYPYLVDSIPNYQVIIPPKDSIGICVTERDSTIKLLQWYSETKQALFSTQEACGAPDCEPIWIITTEIIKEERECVISQTDADTITMTRFPIGKHLRKGSLSDRCKITSTFKDSPKIPICGPDNDPTSYKFVRSWYIINWCTNEAINDIHQIIKVVDTIPPMYSVPDTLPLVSTDPWTCVRNVGIPAPVNLKDNCTPSQRLTWKARIYINGGYKEANAANNYIFTNLEVGEYDVVYEVSDECDNTREMKSKVKIIDRAKPIVITKSVIVVTFSEFEGNCTAKIFPHNVDGGSHDACDGNKVLKEIKRFSDSKYGEFVKFDEDDLTGINDLGVPYGEVKVEIKVTDKSGNYSIGWTTVRVEDKGSQIVVDCGKSDIKLDCHEDLETAIDQYKPKVTLKACEDKLLDVGHVITKNNLNPKCNTGTIYVEYRLSGDSICSKKFYFGDIDSTRIIWPDEEIIASCNDAYFGDPIINDEYCSLLAQSLEVREFDLPEGTGYCKKIIRTFTIIDWCLYKVNSNNDTLGLYRFNQVIKIKDDVKPDITCIAQDIPIGPTCRKSGFSVSARGSDGGDCSSENLEWEARLDINGDGYFEYELAPTVSPGSDLASAVVDTLLTNGTYFVRWKATDECGNSDVKVCAFNLIDDKAPTPVCISNISTALMNTSGQVTIWASDFDPTGKSDDACGHPLYYSFSDTSAHVPSLTFDCYDIPNGISQIVELPLYVWDASGNYDFCTVRVRLDDNSDYCEDIVDGAAVITGSIRTEGGELVESAEVEVFSYGQNYLGHKMTGVEGQYAFMDTPMDYDYVVTVSKNDGILNGVTTLDLLLIQRHILSIGSFTSPYKVIAADINNDEHITALDLVELRSLILGLREDFANNRSWRFINAYQKFDDILRPWPLEEEINIFDLPSHMDKQDFIAVKVGDVNGTAIANSLSAGGRSVNAAYLTGKDVWLEKDQEKTVHLKLDEPEGIHGFQLALDIENADLKSVFSNVILTDDQMVLGPRNLKMSWTGDVNRPANEVVLSMTLKADKRIRLSEVIRLNSELMSAESYVGSALNTEKIIVQLEDNTENGMVFDLYQNRPNPFSDETVVGFVLPKAGDADLKIYDITGKQIYKLSRSYDSGYQEIRIQKELLKGSGVLYYQLSFEGNIATRKMILIE